MKRRKGTQPALKIKPGAVFVDPQTKSAPDQVYVLSIDEDGSVRIGTTRSGTCVFLREGFPIQIPRTYSSLKFCSTWSLLQFLIDNGFRQTQANQAGFQSEAEKTLTAEIALRIRYEIDREIIRDVFWNKDGS